MSVTSSISDTNEKALEVGERYLDSTVKYYKLKLFKNLSISVSMAFKGMVIGGFALSGILMLSIALAILIGEATGSYAMGFAIIATAFIALAIISFLLKEKITKMVLKKMSKKFFA